MKRLAVLGAGSWGTALAIVLAPRFESVFLWARDGAQAAAITEKRENDRYLPGFRLDDRIAVSHEPGAIAEADVILSVVPSLYLREALQQVSRHVRADMPLVSATKGIEEDTLLRMSQVLRTALPVKPPIAVISGPTFAREIVAGEPAALVVAAEDKGVAEEIQQAFATRTLRLYTSADVIGVETGAALKNVIAIGAGICGGLGLGSNSVAALVTRGLAEVTRLALAMGANGRTLSGLTGLGDLVLTATGHLSRNRSLGVELGLGRKLPAILAGMKMVAEGVSTCRAAHQLGARHGVDLPIINKMYEVLYEEKDPRAAIRELMERPLTSE